MSGTAPEPSDAARTRPDTPPEDGDLADPAPRGARGWRWLVAALVVVLVALLAWRPWDAPDPVVVPSPDAVTTLETPVEPTPEATPSPTSSPAPRPGANAVFDPTTAATLFSTSADLEAGVPAAAAGVSRGLEPGSRPWGLRDGARVEPASCTAAVTVVSVPPSHHDAASWGNEEFTFEEDVVLLLDPAAARAAFRALVTTVDECPRYALVEPGTDGTRWTAEPALEGQGVFPAIVHDVTAEVDGDTFQQTTGHVLVGNAILTWTATALDAEDREAARAVLGEPAALSEMVERRALAAVRGIT